MCACGVNLVVVSRSGFEADDGRMCRSKRKKWDWMQRRCVGDCGETLGLKEWDPVSVWRTFMKVNFAGCRKHTHVRSRVYTEMHYFPI